MPAIKYRMGAGYAGTVSRPDEAVIEPSMSDAVAPVASYGLAVNVNAAGSGVRQVAPADTAIFGFAVRPYPFQPSSAAGFGAAAFGTGGPAAFQAVDVLKSGYILLPINGASAKGAPVFIWVAASNGNHVQGGAEIVASAGNTVALDSKSYFNGAPDATGIGEIAFNL
jgi:hypothetical protein